MPLTITSFDLRSFRPAGFDSEYDKQYANIATRLFNASRLASAELMLSQEDRKFLSIKLAMYLEDIIADIGIWRSFVEAHQQLYGKPLPFYQTNDDYYPDEPHFEDIMFLIWHELLSVHRNRIFNPNCEPIRQLAKAMYAIIDKEFDRAPENHGLRKWFEEATFMDDFILFRNMLHFMFFQCYLTQSDDSDEYLSHTIETLENLFHRECEEWMPYDPIYYMASNTAIFQFKIGPLALYPKQWIANLLRSNGNEDAAKRAEEVKFKTISVFKILKHDPESITFMNLDGESFVVDKLSFGEHIDEALANNKIYMGAFARFDGRWNTNGLSSWMNNVKDFDKELKENEKRRKQFVNYDYSSWIAKHNGQQLFYFASKKEFDEFAKSELQMNVDNLNEDRPIDNITVFINPSTSNVSVLCNVAPCINDANNPFYDTAIAHEETTNLLLNTDNTADELIHHLIANKMLNEGSLPDDGNPSMSQRLMQDNIDFLARVLRHNDY